MIIEYVKRPRPIHDTGKRSRKTSVSHRGKQEVELDLTPKDVNITRPVAEWHHESEQKDLNITMKLNHDWKDLIQYEPTTEEENCIQGLVDKFLHEDLQVDPHMRNFRRMTTLLYQDIYFPDTVMEKDVEIDAPAQETWHERVLRKRRKREAAGETISVSHMKAREEMIMEDPVPKITKARSRKKVTITKRPLKETTNSAATDRDFVLKPVLKPVSRGQCEYVRPDFTEDEVLAQLQIYTKTMRKSFMAIIEQVFTEYTGIDVAVMERSTSILHSGSERGRFSSALTDRCFFSTPGDLVAGGAPLLGIVDKCMTFETRKTQIESLKIQVAGEMITCAYQRHWGFRYQRYDCATLVCEQPSFQLRGTEESQVVVFLVFTHRSVNLVSARIPISYLENLVRGTLQPCDQLEFRWSKRYPLHERDTNLSEAVRMILTVFFQLGHLWRSGEHFWRPFWGATGNLIF